MNKRAASIGELVLNYSSIICLIDCILLPVIVVFLGFLNVVSNFEAIERASHISELCLIIPTGSISIIFNFKRSRNILLFISGLIGILVVILSNLFQSSLLHSVFSILGCLLLLCSNFVSRKFYKDPKLNHGDLPLKA